MGLFCVGIMHTNLYWTSTLSHRNKIILKRKPPATCHLLHYAQNTSDSLLPHTPPPHMRLHSSSVTGHCNWVDSPLNSYLYVHWILDFKQILLLLFIIIIHCYCQSLCLVSPLQSLIIDEVNPTNTN